MSVRPPRLADWLLTLRVPAEWRDFVVGDLHEEFAERATVTPARARRWFWRQTWRCLLNPLPPRHGSSPASATRSRREPLARTLATDLRTAVRGLVRAPAFSLGVVVVLALGIGATTAIFSIVNGVLLRPLPYDDPDRLVRLFHVPPQAAFPGIARFPLSPANFYDWHRASTRFSGMAIYRFRQFTRTDAAEPEPILAGAVGAGFFDVVGTRPALGRDFHPDEDRPGRDHVAIVSDRFWKGRLGGSGDVLGRTLTLDGERYAIVGVLPGRFSIAAWGLADRDIMVPLAYSETERAVRDNHNAQVVARLAPGVSVAEARTELEAISARLEREYPKDNAGWGATVITLQELIVGDVRMSLVLLLASVALVLLIACANVANLLLARGLARRKELAIRYALGAGRGRVFQQLVVEALVLASIGGVVGLLLARLGLAASTSLLANQIPRADEISIDTSVLLFLVAASCVTGLLAGALPALRAGRSDLQHALKEGGRSDAAVGLGTRRLLIAGEVALSVVLLAGAGVMTRSLVALRQVDAGFDPRQVLTMRVTLPERKYQTAPQRTAFFDTALDRLRALPGVQAAGAIEDLPFAGGSVQPIVVDGRAELLPRDQPTVEVRKITPGYLTAMRIPLLRGRDVREGDVDVLLVSRAAAALLWGDVDPIDHRAVLPLQSRTRSLQVIGVIGDVREAGLSENPVASVYEFSRERDWSSMCFALRTTVPPESIARPAAGVIRNLDEAQPVEDVRTMNELVDETMGSRHFSAVVLALFSGVALTLAAVGIYSVLSHIVRGRSREIGIRTALGARTSNVLGLVLYEGMIPTIAGIAAGTLAALAFGAMLERLTFGVRPSDPLTLAAVAVTLLAVAVIASILPASRAAKVDPLKVLRTN
jgi:predicted permease